jgi:hypothetical protein
MRFVCLAGLLASACAFSSHPAALTTQSPVLGGRAVDNIVAPNNSHRNRRATIVMDGKANGKLNIDSIAAHTNVNPKCPRMLFVNWNALTNGEIFVRNKKSNNVEPTGSCGVEIATRLNIVKGGDHSRDIPW